jgi:hypothetical protein
VLTWEQSAATPALDVSGGQLAKKKKSLQRRQHTGSTTDIVESELTDSGVELQEKRQRLANTTTGTENGDLGGLRVYSLVSFVQGIGLEESCMRWISKERKTHIASGHGEGSALNSTESLTSGKHVDMVEGGFVGQRDSLSKGRNSKRLCSQGKLEPIMLAWQEGTPSFLRPSCVPFSVQNVHDLSHTSGQGNLAFFYHEYHEAEIWA